VTLALLYRSAYRGVVNDNAATWRFRCTGYGREEPRPDTYQQVWPQLLANPDTCVPDKFLPSRQKSLVESSHSVGDDSGGSRTQTQEVTISILGGPPGRSVLDHLCASRMRASQSF
jgi:hypothetical protein